MYGNSHNNIKLFLLILLHMLISLRLGKISLLNSPFTDILQVIPAHDAGDAAGKQKEVCLIYILL